ncbi:MAG: class I SAM-dependent methyltransferase [Thermoguttaceae bacterium]
MNCSLSSENIRTALASYQGEKHVTDEMAIPSYLHWNPLVRWIIRERLRVVQRMILTKKPVARNILDFGCGLGLMSVLLADHCETITSVDLEIEPAQCVQRYYGIENMFPVDAKKFDWSGNYDAVIAADVLEHVDDLELFLDKIKSVVNPQTGQLILSGPTENWFYSLCRKIAGFKGDYHERSIFDIEEVLRQSGWKMTEIRSIPWFLPVKMFRVSIWNPPKQ